MYCCYNFILVVLLFVCVFFCVCFFCFVVGGFCGVVVFCVGFCEIGI